MWKYFVMKAYWNRLMPRHSLKLLLILSEKYANVFQYEIVSSIKLSEILSYRVASIT
jgi:hypothetical protein